MLDMSYAGPHVCPGCGERVSAFAAGCALCGADLDPKRAQGPVSLGERLRRRVGRLAHECRRELAGATAEREGARGRR